MNIVDRLSGLLGAAHVLQGNEAEPFLVDWRGRYRGRALAVLRPGSADEVAAVVRACAEAAVPIVPQGGNTGLCGGATPDDSGRAVVLSLARLRRVRAVDADNDSIEVEAGCTLQAVQEAAATAGRLFPLSLAAEGSCTIGGNLATNAGGVHVLRYGTMRELALGLEVVTASGEVWHGLRTLRKDNTGYSLRDLFIGSEGTLGIITAATLRLFPQPAGRASALVALESLAAAASFLAAARRALGPALGAFELMARECLQLVEQQFPAQRLPFGGEAGELPWFVLLELCDAESAEHAAARLEAVLGEALQAGRIADAVLGTSHAQARALWHLRESIPLAEKAAGKSIKHDISLPVSRMESFVRDTNAALQAAFPGVRHVIFGHLGDGNLHYNVAAGGVWTEERLLAAQDAIFELVHDRVHAAGGSISAEHGIGQLKRAILPRYQDPVGIALMRSVKAALDPAGILNPGKLL